MKIICISHCVYNKDKYKRTLTSKILKVLSKHFVIINYIYTYKKESYNNEDIIQYKVPLKRGSLFSPFINLIYIYFKNTKIIYKSKSDLIWIGTTSGYHTSLLFIYRLLFRKRKIFIQLFTPNVNKSRVKRYLNNTVLKMNLKFFNYIGSGTNDNVIIYKIPKYKLIELEVGYPDYGFSLRAFKNLNLIYLGTINNRELFKTVEGLNMFLKRNKDFLTNKMINVTYDIIGGGSSDDIKMIKNAIIRQNLSNIIKYHGYLEEVDVKKLLKKANVGVAYLPKTNYFNNLSSTKIVEYFLTGMPVLSVDTKFAKKVVNNKSGILCTDSSEGFAIGLEEILMKLNNYDSKEIRNMYEEYTINKVIEQNYIPQLLQI